MTRSKEFNALKRLMECPSKPFALLGAGTSVDSGYPDWNTLLCLLEKIAIEEGDDTFGPRYQKYLRTLNDPAWQAEEYRRIMGENVFKRFICDAFKNKNYVGPVIQAIVNLEFRHILTTNYDSCIEEGYKLAKRKIQPVEWNENSKMRSFFLDLSRNKKEPYLIYLHGRNYEPDNIILTETSYANRYLRSDDARRKLFSLLITQPVVLIGFSINDPDLNHILREVNVRLGFGDPQHFALMGYELEEHKQLIKRRFEGKYGVQPVFYKIKRKGIKEDHSNLLKLLKELYRDLNNDKELALLESGNKPVLQDCKYIIDDCELEDLDPFDRQKGRWGGKSESNNRKLRVENVRVFDRVCSFDIIIETIDEEKDPKLNGQVVIHLHETFEKIVNKITVEDGKAVLKEVYAYGAFTIGAEADRGKTFLELDLSQDTQFPKWFRKS